MPTYLITGANRGIGLELVRQLAGRGDVVVATVRDRARAADLDDLAARTGRVTVAELDAASEASANALSATLAGRPLDVLVNNAGVLNSYGGFTDPSHDEKAWHDVLMTNVAGPFFVSRALHANLKAGSLKKLVFISSVMGSSTRARAAPYRASKAAITNIALGLSHELKPDGIAVAAFHPGWVKTSMGGSGASIMVEQSAAGLIARIDHLTLATTGVFEDYKGDPIPI